MSFKIKLLLFVLQIILFTVGVTLAKDYVSFAIGWSAMLIWNAVNYFFSEYKIVKK